MNGQCVNDVNSTTSKYEIAVIETGQGNNFILFIHFWKHENFFKAMVKTFKLHVR